MRLKIAATILLLGGFTGIVAFEETVPKGTQEAPRAHKIVVQTELMEVRAVVTDKSGRLIQNLEKEDFELLENGQPQEISFFTVSEVEGDKGGGLTRKPGDALPGKRAPGGGGGLEDRLKEAPLRSTLLFVDNIHTSFGSLNRIKEAVRRFVKEQLTDRDAVALATSGQSLGLAQQFTQDRRILNYAVEQMRLGPFASESFFPPRLAADVLQDRIESMKLAVAMVREAERTRCPCGSMITIAQNKARADLAWASRSRNAVLETLQGYAEQMMGLPGKRMIVVFSEGFTMLNGSGEKHDNEIQALIDRAARSGVVIYSIDAKSLQGPSIMDASKSQSAATGLGEDDTLCRDELGPPGNPRCRPPGPSLYHSMANMSEQEALDGLAFMADGTGGKMFQNTNDLAGALQGAFEANRFYYVLAYYLTPRSDEKRFRNIKVQVRNHPEYRVQTVRGYWPADMRAAAAEEPGKTPQQQLLQAMKAPLPATGIGVSAQAHFLETEHDDKQVTLAVYFNGDRFKYREQDQRHLVNLEIMYVIVDASGKQVHGTSARVEGSLTSERLAQAKTSGFRFSQRLMLAPGVYQARIGVREEGTDRMGTATAWVEVPQVAPDKFEISSLMLYNPLDTDPSDTEGINVSELEQLKMIQGMPLYARDEACDYFFRIHRGLQTGAHADLTWMSELYRDGKPVRQAKWLPVPIEEEYVDGKGWFDLESDVEFEGLDSGIYELRVSVRDARTHKTIERTTVFGID